MQGAPRPSLCPPKPKVLLGAPTSFTALNLLQGTHAIRLGLPQRISAEVTARHGHAEPLPCAHDPPIVLYGHLPTTMQGGPSGSPLPPPPRGGHRGSRLRSVSSPPGGEFGRDSPSPPIYASTKGKPRPNGRATSITHPSSSLPNARKASSHPRGTATSHTDDPTRNFPKPLKTNHFLPYLVYGAKGEEVREGTSGNPLLPITSPSWPRLAATPFLAGFLPLSSREIPLKFLGGFLLRLPRYRRGSSKP